MLCAQAEEEREKEGKHRGCQSPLMAVEFGMYGFGLREGELPAFASGAT